MEMDEAVKPEFIFYSVGHSKRGKADSATFDVVGNMKAVVDEYCRVHLSASAYAKVMDESMASEKTKK